MSIFDAKDIFDGLDIKVSDEAVSAVRVFLFRVGREKEVLDFAELGKVVDEFAGCCLECNSSNEDFGGFGTNSL